jgi:hypothetical protein
MKQHTFRFIATALVAILFFAGCKKEDVTKPVVTLLGANPMTLNVGDVFTDPGATATDDVDGNLTSSITATGTVNAAMSGTYTRTYSVTDAAGNIGTASRTVNVVLTRDAILGTYTTSNTCPAPPYSGMATTTNFQAGSGANQFTINMFYFNGGTLSCTIDGAAVTVDAGQAPNPWFDGVTGSGTFNAAGTQLVMTYTFQPNGGSPTTCDVTYTN